MADVGSAAALRVVAAPRADLPSAGARGDSGGGRPAAAAAAVGRRRRQTQTPAAHQNPGSPLTEFYRANAEYLVLLR